MLNCRFKIYPSEGFRGAHVHDDPGYIADAQRCQDNGWQVWVDGKCHVEGPFTRGDSKLSFKVILDLVKGQ